MLLGLAMDFALYWVDFRWIFRKHFYNSQFIISYAELRLTIGYAEVKGVKAKCLVGIIYFGHLDFSLFPLRFSLNNVSLFVNISDICRPFDALRIAMLIASLWFGVKNGKSQAFPLNRCHSVFYAVSSSKLQ